MDISSDLDAILEGAATARFRAGDVIAAPGSDCAHFIVVRTGGVRVDLLSPSGRQVLLYRFGAGETCVLTTASLFSGAPYAAEARAETDVEAALITAAQFHDRVRASEPFRRMVFETFSRRLADAMAKIDEIAFQPLAARLAALLIRIATDGLARGTHESFAIDIGTAREVVSRALADWERAGWIERRRGAVALLAPDALARLAAGDNVTDRPGPEA